MKTKERIEEVQREINNTKNVISDNNKKTFEITAKIKQNGKI